MSGEKNVGITQTDFIYCPFCGGRNCQKIQRITLGEREKFYALCFCGQSTRAVDSPAEALILWNTRQRPQPSQSTPETAVAV